MTSIVSAQRRRLTSPDPIAIVMVLACCGCRAGGGLAPPLVQPGAPGQSTRAISAERAVDLPAVRHTAAETRFMQGMIAHHAQALEMTKLLAARSERETMQQLGKRI